MEIYQTALGNGTRGATKTLIPKKIWREWDLSKEIMRNNSRYTRKLDNVELRNTLKISLVAAPNGFTPLMSWSGTKVKC